MLSYKGKVVNRQCIVPVWGFNPTQDHLGMLPKTDSGTAPYTFRALVDTGSTVTCISKRVVEDLGLESQGTHVIRSASQVAEANLYLLVLLLDSDIADDTAGVSNLRQFGLRVTGLGSSSPEFDILLGMDVLEKCEFSMANGAFVLSY